MRFDAVRRFASRAEWLAARRIGSSDAAKILGVAPASYGGAWSVWQRLRGQASAAPQTSDQARGHRWEPVVLTMYGAMHDLEVRQPPEHALYEGPEEWATASPDAFAVDGGQWGLVEAKTDRNGDQRWGESCTIERWEPGAETIVPPDYALQVYHQMWCLDAPWCDLVVLLPFYDLRVFRLVRDAEVEQLLVEQLRGWWERHIVAGEEPPVDGTDACSSALAERFGAAEKGDMRAGRPEEVELAIQYERVRLQLRALEGEKKRLGNELVSAIGERYGLTLGTGKAKVIAVRNEGRAYLDERALLAAHPELAPTLDAHRKRGRPSAHPRVYHLET